MTTVDPLNILREDVAAVVGQMFDSYRLRRYRGRKVIRDVVWGMIDILPHELALIDSPLFQRLRGVNQTSLALLTYPSAGHSRFEHSLGALAVADRVLYALTSRLIEIDNSQRLEVRLAALLHDWSHGPLSHTSESFYKSNPIFASIKARHPKLFRRASASEILTYCVITCAPFQQLWEKMNNQYSTISGCDPWRIATMIIGADVNTEKPSASIPPRRRFLRQLINGPFDVDKLDYIARDGYFTGLHLGVDVERLLWVLNTIEQKDKDNETACLLCVSASGATILEQVLYSKMQLFSSVYHHHKVRVAHQAALRLLSSLEEAEVQIKGRSLSDPATFLCLNDSDILQACFQDSGTKLESLQEARTLAKSIQDRTLPMRALVLTHPVWGQDPNAALDEDRESWVDAMKAPDQPGRLAAEIAGIAGVDPRDVWVDIPDMVSLQGTGQEGLIKFDDRTALPIQEMFPIGGWLSAYQSYRLISYIFARVNRQKVGQAARDMLATEAYNIKINDVALKLARIEYNNANHD